MHKALKTLRAFDVAQATVTVWAFKKSVREGKPVFTGRWVDTTIALDAALQNAVMEARDGLTETLDYALLAQNNEGSALTIALDETYAAYVLAEAAEATPKRKVKKLKEVANAAFYVVKLVTDEKIIYAARHTDDSWRTRRAAGTLSVVFEDNQLELDQRPRFSLSKHFDFFIVDDTILVTQKPRFESLLHYKAAHMEDFATLRAEPEFAKLFSSMQPLIDYVGTNKIQLRRASAIRQKANYKDSEFMNRLRAESKKLGFKIQFDKKGRIVATTETCRDIFQALLDHRLDSRLSQRLYDVENTAAVSI